MSLQKADFTFTDSDGFIKRYEETVVATVIFHYQTASIETVYHAWRTAEERDAGVPARTIRQTLEVDFQDAEILALLLNVSAKLWQVNFTAPFLTDYSGRKDGKVDAKTKSLQQLGAVIKEADFAELKSGKLTK